MPKQRNGNEVTVHTVKLTSHSSEFQDVVQTFQRTAGPAVVASVERIQNPLLYRAYQLRKQKMDKDNGGNNERQLFHGTASRNVKKINSQGFNRNFSGLAHGKLHLHGPSKRFLIPKAITICQNWPAGLAVSNVKWAFSCPVLFIIFLVLFVVFPMPQTIWQFANI